MKRMFSLLFLCGIVTFLSAQNSFTNVKMKSKAVYHDGTRAATPAPLEKTHFYMKQQLQQQFMQQQGGSRNVTAVQIGTAGNLFTILSSGVNRIAANNDLNTVIFIHRSNPAQFPASNLGQYRYDISYDGGGTWELNYGVLNPKGNQQTLAGRYPNVAIHNPANNTDPDNAYLAYLGTWLPFDAGGDWDGLFTGVARLDNDTMTFTENVLYPNNQDINITEGMCNGAPGVFWAVNWENVSSTAFDPSAILVFKGVWNSSTSDVDWTMHTTITPNFDKSIEGTAQATAINMAFDPTGQYGWISFLGDITAGGDTAFSVNFYRTVNGGSTWTGPIVVDLATLPNVVNNLVAGTVPTTAFDMDIVVDVNGNPHGAVVIGSAGAGQAYSIATGTAAGLKIYDITYVPTAAANCRWQAILLDDVFTFRGDISADVSEDNRPQCSLSPDGAKVFFSWLDSDANITGGTNELPNLKTKALDVVTGLATDVVNWTDTDPVWSGGALFGSLSPNTLFSGGTYTVPTVFAQLTGTPDADPVHFFYIQDIQYVDGDFVNDVWAPVITLNGTSPTTVVVNTAYTDQGASAFDNNDGNISGSIITNNTVNANAVGTYTVTYSITDSEGNVACDVTRIVNVVSSPDNTPPVITLTGASTVTVDVCDFFADLGATATDNLDGNITGNIVVTSTVPGVLTPGTYTIDYDVTDGAGNAATTVTRTVIVADLPPTITLNGPSTINIELCQPYVEQSAVAVDLCLGSVEVTITNNINLNAVGSYTVTYTATDGVNTPSTETRTVNITPDVTPPSITLVGANPQFVYLGTPYTELGASAFDCADGNISGNVNSTGSSINTSSRDTVIVQYTVSDNAGNAATAVTRSVIINTEPDPDFTFVISGGTVFFTDASLYNPTSYQWDFGDQSQNVSKNPSHTYTANGDYNVCLKSANAFNAAPFNKPIKETCKTVSVTQVGIEETLVGKHFDIYPNPSTGLVTVEIKDATFEKVNLSIYDAAGKEVTSIQLGGQNAGSKYGLNLSGNPEGVYVIKIQTEQGAASKSIILDR